MKIVLHRDDGTTENITELVRIAYDVAVGSMDYSSGFLDKEEVDGLLRLAFACDFPSAREEAIEMWRKEAYEALRAEAVGTSLYERTRQVAEGRGVQFWHEIQPTDAELNEFIEGLKAGRTR